MRKKCRAHHADGRSMWRLVSTFQMPAGRSFCEAARLWLIGAVAATLLAACIAEEDETEVQTIVVEQPAEDNSQPQQPATTVSNDPPPTGSAGLAGVTDLILVTGQSNATGSALGFDAARDRPNSRLHAFTDEGWRVADLTQFWDGAHPGNFVTAEPDRLPYNNFAFHFGKTIVENRSDRTVAFVLITAPGMAIEHWDRDQPFFSQIRAKAITALNQVPNKTAFDGILWHQGESDAQDNDYYTNKLNQLIGNFRAESWFAGDGVFICGETASLPVNNRLMALNSDGDDNTACVTSAGAQVLSDGVHFSAEGLRVIGERYGWQYITMRPRPRQ